MKKKKTSWNVFPEDDQFWERRDYKISDKIFINAFRAEKKNSKEQYIWHYHFMEGRSTIDSDGIVCEIHELLGRDPESLTEQEISLFCLKYLG
jgi:hypothetical protein